MKSIQLHTAAVDNGGSRREAGDVVEIGKRADQIDADRAKDMVTRQMAAEPKPDAPTAADQ